MKTGKKTSKLARAFRVDHGKSFRLKDFDPADTQGILTREQAPQLLEQHVAAMAELQDKLYAQDQWALLLIFQAMDAAGKDGVVKHVFSGVNPTGCEVTSFKQPSAEELEHDYLWRATKRLPPRGKIGIFNRSYYEEVLVVRVHQELLKKELLPPKLISKDIWKERFHDIRNLESFLTRNGTIVRKFFLNLSKEEQQRRFLARLEEPEKNWKFSDSDVHERACWDDYMEAYEDMIRHTATPEAPWYVVPSDHKGFMHAAVSAVVIETLKDLKLSYPTVDRARRKQLAVARAALEKEKG
jgi:PPK2 family polyphosphate:nucleotide phosphotransferase